MGQYYSAVCRDCKVVLHPTLAKLREIEMNEIVSAEIGRFFIEHRHHDIDLVGDEGDGEYDFEGYEHILTPSRMALRRHRLKSTPNQSCFSQKLKVQPNPRPLTRQNPNTPSNPPPKRTPPR